MSQSRRPNSQQKSIAQSINNLKTQLQQQKQNRWSQQKVNQELFDFLTQINLQQHYNKIAQYCDGSLQQLSTGSIKEIKDLPIGHQLKLQKALEKLPKKEEKNESKFMEQILQNDQKECCWICFQLIFQGIDCYGKKLCSEKCKQNYLKEIQINCKRCGKLKPKYEAQNSYGEWYCDENCVYSVEELMMLLMKQSQLKM